MILNSITPGTTNKKTVQADDDYIRSLIQKIPVLFAGKQFCDVTLISNDECKIEAHKIILCAGSEYFSGMFCGSLCEANADEVKLSQVDGHSLQIVINFIYTGSVELSTDTVEYILEAGQIFQLDSLVTLCCDYAANQLDPSNCIGIALFAEHHNCKELLDTAEDFMGRHFVTVRNCEELLKMNVDHFEKIISSDMLRVQSEEDVFHTIMSWVEHKRTEREEFIGKLLLKVRFPLLMPKFIANTVQVACTTTECELLISKAYKWHLLPEFRESLFPEELTKLRHFQNTMIVISGWNNPERILSVGLYNFESNGWIQIEWLGPERNRTHFGSTTVNGKLIIAGGRLASGDATNHVECLDLITLQWTNLSPMGKERYSFRMVTLNGKVYALGGKDSTNTALSSVEKFDPMTGKWEYVDSMPTTNISQAAVCVNSLWVRFPGNQGLFYSYDPDDNTWCSKRTPLANGELLGMGTVSDYFIFVWRTCITKFNLSTTTSVNVNIGELKDQYTNCAVFGDRLIVYGKNVFQEYLLFQNKWKAMPPLTKNEGEFIVIQL